MRKIVRWKERALEAEDRIRKMRHDRVWAGGPFSFDPKIWEWSESAEGTLFISKRGA